jgi:hypothetical protein
MFQQTCNPPTPKASAWQALTCLAVVPLGRTKEERSTPKGFARHGGQAEQAVQRPIDSVGREFGIAEPVQRRRRAGKTQLLKSVGPLSFALHAETHCSEQDQKSGRKAF